MEQSESACQETPTPVKACTIELVWTLLTALALLGLGGLLYYVEALFAGHLQRPVLLHGLIVAYPLLALALIGCAVAAYARRSIPFARATAFLLLVPVPLWVTMALCSPEPLFAGYVLLAVVPPAYMWWNTANRWYGTAPQD